mmetsp:Transcript_26704/g.92767  ORF Transcript_26704/g.92767 Transcript_26704/m.92767 type:complete len:348 (-) Transcript_26704:923-1966(-)
MPRAAAAAAVAIVIAASVCAHAAASFADYEDCSSCLAAGHGWCPIRRRCGGFANRQCSGTETDVVKPTLAAVGSAADFDAAVFDDSRTVFVVLHGAGDGGLEELEAAARGVAKELKNAPSVGFVSVACADVPSACLLAPRGGASTATLVAAQRVPFVDDGAGSGGDAGFGAGDDLRLTAGSDEGGFGSQAAANAKPVLRFSGDVTDAAAVQAWMLATHDAARVRLPEMDALAVRFMAAYVEAGMKDSDAVDEVMREARVVAMGSEEAAATTMREVDVSEGGETSRAEGRPTRAAVAAMYTATMRDVLAKGPSSLARAVNARRSSGAQLPAFEAARLEVLEVFVAELF